MGNFDRTVDVEFTVGDIRRKYSALDGMRPSVSYKSEIDGFRIVFFYYGFAGVRENAKLKKALECFAKSVKQTFSDMKIEVNVDCPNLYLHPVIKFA